MATRVKLETKGFAEYLEKIAQAGQDVDFVAASALEAGGGILVSGMKRRAPVLKEPDPRYRPGHLRDSIIMDGPHRDGNFHYIEVGIPTKGAKKVDVDTARYANAQEYGTSSMGAQTYIRPTLDSDMSKARKVMRAVFEEMGLI